MIAFHLYISENYVIKTTISEEPNKLAPLAHQEKKIAKLSVVVFI